VLISYGPNQTRDYGLSGTVYTSQGDDILAPLAMDDAAADVVREELGELMKRVEAYDRVFAGVQNNPATDWDFISGEDREVYGDTGWGAPPALDPDFYDFHYAVYPQIYPVFPIGGYPLTPAGPVPTWEELIMYEPGGWPGVGAYDGDILNDWPANFAALYGDLAPTSVALGQDNEWSPNVIGMQSANDADQGTMDPFDPDAGYFGMYPYPVLPAASLLPFPVWYSARHTFELIDEDGCVQQLGGSGGVGCLPNADFTNDPNCGRATLDGCTPGNELNDLVQLYGLGQQYLLDPWGNPYEWGRGIPETDRRYHVFFSRGPDGTLYTDDDITLY
jgi:hypothetical protein